MKEITRIPAPDYKEQGPKLLTDSQKESCRKIVALLPFAFSWQSSAEGYEFWKQVHWRLNGLSEDEPLKK